MVRALPSDDERSNFRPSSPPVSSGTSATVDVVLGPPTPAEQTGIGKRLDTDQVMGDDTLEFEAGRVMAEEIAGPLGITGTGRSS